jgi:hypothetical protein
MALLEKLLPIDWGKWDPLPETSEEGEQGTLGAVQCFFPYEWTTACASQVSFNLLM